MAIRLIAVLGMCLLPFLVSSQVRGDTARQGGVIIIDYFGRLIEDIQGVEPVKWISKEFQLRIDSTFIYGDSAVIYGEDRVHAYRDIVIQQADSLNVFTDTLLYFRDRDVAHLRGEVVLQQGRRQLWTRHLTYFLGSKYGEYNFGGTLIDGPLQVTSKRGLYWARNEEIRFQDSVIVLHPEFNLTADSLRYLALQSLVRFTGPTHIHTRSSKIYCEGGFYDLKNEIAEFNVHPAYVSKDKRATADTIRYASRTGEVEMTGNVSVIEAGRTITGSFLRYLENTGETWITGMPAVFRDSTRSIVSPEIFFNEKTNQVVTTGRGEISFDDFIIEADHFTYDQTTGYGQATGNVEWVDTLNNTGIRAENIDYSRENDFMLAYGKGRQMLFTVMDADTLFITADTLNMWREIDSVGVMVASMDSTMAMDSTEAGMETIKFDTVRMMKAYYDVRLYKSNLQGIADSLVFNGRDSLFTYYGDPVLWSDTSQFSADTIFMHLRNHQIRDVVLHRRAMIISQILGTYYDQIKGKNIVADFDSSRIRQMVVSGNAESIYYTRDDQSAFIGVNQTICTSMFFSFLENEIHLLKYYGENNSTMLPMHEADHLNLRLEGFRWRNDERPLSIDDLK